MSVLQWIIVTAMAIIAHEIPQEVGDFAILLHSGYSKATAFQLNLISSFAFVAGGVLGLHLADHAIVDTVVAGTGGGEHDLCCCGRSDTRPAQMRAVARRAGAGWADLSLSKLSKHQPERNGCRELYNA